MPGATLGSMSDPTLVIVVAALVRRDESVLLVEQAAGDEPPAWMLPGGRVERGETLLTALARELMEETGLRMITTRGIAFAVEVRAGDPGYFVITFDVEAAGAIRPADPDGLVRSAAWVPAQTAMERLRCVTWYDCVPLTRYLSGAAPAGAVYSGGSE